MERADVAVMTSRLRAALLGAGPDVSERRTVSGNAFLVSGRAVGQFEERAGTLRVRLWLLDKDRAAFEARPTFDRDSGWLHVISDEDVAFVCSLAPHAYKAAASGRAAPPGARTVEVPRATLSLEDKRKGAAPRRPPSRSARPRA